MSYSYARINLEKTNYSKIDNFQTLINPIPKELNEEQKKYIKEKLYKGGRK